MSYWTVVYTDVSAERDVRRGLEGLGYGAFLPYYREGYWRGEKLQFREKALLPRYVLANLPDDAAWGPIHQIHGANRVLTDAGAPARVPADQVATMMLSHASGLYNTTAPRRDAAGRFRKHKRRRRRPRHGKVYTGRPETVVG